MRTMTANRVITMGSATIAVIVLLVLPFFTSGFFTSTVGIRALWLGMAAVSLTFLAGYGGMVSLAQTALYGIAGFTMANLVAADGGVQHIRLLGLDLGDNWPPIWAAVAGIVVATLIGLGFGALAGRSEGIYFLMLTLALGVLTYYFFGQVASLSGFGGVNQVPHPGWVGDPLDRADRLYYVTLVVVGRDLSAHPLHRPHPVWDRVAGNPRRPCSDALARLSRRAASRARLWSRRVRRQHRRSVQRLVQRPDLAWARST